MTRQSLQLQDQDWRELQRLAEATGSTWRGRASWRTLVRRVAQGQLLVVPPQQIWQELGLTEHST